MLRITNPANGSTLREIPEDTTATINAKFESAKSAQKAWAATPLETRKAAITKFKEKLDAAKADLAATLTAEVGKPLAQSMGEIKGTLARIDFFLNEVEATTKDETVHTEANLREVISHEPLGVIANISAWNYPYFVGSNVFVPALLTGNAVLYKPSEFATLTGLAITDLLHASGIPKDIFIPVIGGGLVGAELMKQNLNGVFFTGSYATGKKIAEVAGSKLMKVQLELGGKDPSYICEDLDEAAVKNAAESTADGAFYNNGQSCCSVERIYVHTKVYTKFIEHFVATVKGFVMGDPTAEKTYIGPLTRAQQLAVVEAQIADAVHKGAKILTGGKRAPGPGNYFEPTVLVGVNHTMDVMREESFGPVIGIQEVKSDEEALALMNDTAYGLTAGVYTPNEARARAILTNVNSGSVYWNCCDRVSPRLPWSGRGHSGMGATLSKYGIQTFTQLKAWHLRG